MVSTSDAALILPAGETEWQGMIEVREPVRIPRGSSLIIRAGASIQITSPANLFDVSGQIRVEGTPDDRVVFASPKGWRGINFVEAEAGSQIAGAKFSAAETAISSIATDFKVVDSFFEDCGSAIKLLRESSPLIERNRFENNDLAIDNEMRSAPTIQNNIFIGHRKTAILASHNSRGRIADNRFEKNEQGVGLLQTYPDRIENNIFIDNKLALYCNQTKSTPMIKGNRFERNEMALVNYSFAYPAVEDNIFIDNKMAIRNDQYGSPLVKHNLFRGNGTAIYNYRKSNPVVENNLIERNDLALFCDYSSYPRVKKNNFADNKMAVELGIYQSADWEKRSGSKRLMQKEALARKSKNTMLSQAPTKFSDLVDVTDNWWGNSTKTMAKAGADANMPFFYDRIDKEWVTYEGFGPGSYRIDLIVYKPWLEKPVPLVGPRKAQ
jgi:parallel beta-helix repeat protein